MKRFLICLALLISSLFFIGQNSLVLATKDCQATRIGGGVDTWTCSDTQSCGIELGTNQCIDPPSPGTVGGIFGTITPPDALKNLLAPNLTGEQGISSVLSKVVELIYIFAAVVFVFYLLYAALKFIYSEGHKESVQDAKSTITWAIIGVIIMSLTFVILRIVGNITGFKFFN